MQNQEGQQQPPVMMSLLEKYSKMDSQIDYVRQETAKVQLEIQRRQTKTQELFEEREQMKQLQECTLQQQLDLTNGAEKALQKIHQIAEERAQAESKREEAQARLDRMKQRSNDYRQQFFQGSRTFRSQCKRLKMTGQSLGLLNAPLAAHALVNQPHLVQVFEEPDNDYDGGDDLEYTHALEKKLQELEKSHVESKRECDEWQVKKDRLTERSNKRTTQQANLQAQLDRLLKDVQKIQGQIQTVQAQASKNAQRSKNGLQSMDPAPTRGTYISIT
jgi:chromosome segregation ATPase